MRALVLAAHGSSDPGYPEVFDWIADRIIGSRPDLDVVVGYLDHCEPRLAELSTDGAVVVPMLLGSSFHLTVDIPAAAPDAIIAGPLGPDPQLAAIVADRLTEAGWSRGTPVTLAAAGEVGLSDAAALLAAVLDVDVTAVLVGSEQRELDDARAIATYLLAPGHLADLIAKYPAPVISAPLGRDPRLAELAMRRYDAALPLF